MRPHQSKWDYSVNGSYADRLPAPIKWTNRPQGDEFSDQWMTKQCYWLNNDYVKKQVVDLLQ